MRSLLLVAACCFGVAAVTPPNTLVLPAGTPLRIQLETALSSGDAQPGDTFAGRVAQTVYLRGNVAIPAGSIVEGRVSVVQDRTPLEGESALLLRPDFLSLPDGRHFIISAEVTATNAATGVHVGDEGMVESSRKPNVEDARRAGVAGASGLIAGVVLAGAKGALIGSVMGGAFAGGWWLLTHRHAAINPGAELDIRLDRALLLSPENAPVVAAKRASPRTTVMPTRAKTTTATSNANEGSEPAPSTTPKPKVEDLTPHS